MAAVRVAGKQRIQEKQEPVDENIVTRDEVAQVAYKLYTQRGCVDGHDLEDWLKAEAILRDRNGW